MLKQDNHGLQDYNINKVKDRYVSPTSIVFAAACATSRRSDNKHVIPTENNFGR